MKRLLKWVFGGFAVLLLLVVLAGLGLFAIGQRSVAPLSGEALIAGLSAPVSIVRDEHGIPHIEARNQPDAALALGYTHAQDRLWQMELLRMTGQGRLSELFGVNEDIQNTDKLLRSFGFVEQVQGSFDALSGESRLVLEAYAKGVNAYMKRDTGLAEPRLPPEFLILGHAPEKWTPAHSLIVLKIMALNLSMNMGREIDRLRLAAQGLSSSEIDDILPYHADDSPPPLPNLSALYALNPPKEKEAGSADSSSRRYAGITDRFLNEGGRFASNNWVLSGARTTTGKPLLANDPHLTFNAPSLWYLAHMRWPGADGKPINVIGGTIPSIPAVVLGRNDHIAWGFTNAGGDAQDIFVEKMKEDDPDSYLIPDGWKKFELKEETIKVSGGEPITYKRKISRHGPVLPGTFKNHEDVLPANHVLALAWTGLSDRDRNFDVINSFANAQSVADFAGALSFSVAPMQVMVVADTAGDIGLFAKAALPKRQPDNLMAGRAPVPGWLKQYDWDGLLLPDTMPAIENPLGGALGSANTKFVANNTDPFLTYDWTERFRHNRLMSTIINSNKKLDKQAMIDGQLDAYSPAMVALRDHVLKAMSDVASDKAKTDSLQAWDGVMRADAPEPLIIASVFRHALKRILDDDLGPVSEISLTKPAEVMLGILEQNGARNWCDDSSTNTVETCRDSLKAAWADAMSELETAHGSNWKTWRWGNVHTVSNEHQPFGKVWPLNKLFDIERPANGGAYTLQRAKNKFSDDRPYRAVHGAGYRAIYDFENLNKSLFIQTTGQSGNVFSKFYDSMADKWAKGKYLTMSTRDQDYRAASIGEWTLSPAN